MIHVVKRVAFIGLACALVAGCGKKKDEEKVVATAGDVRVTLAEMNAAYNRITPANRPDLSTLEGKRRFANDLLNKGILLAEANRLGGITDAPTLAQLDKAFHNRLATILYREEIESKVDVMGKDVAELYENRKTAVDASHILVDDMAEAARIREEIVSGKISFEDAAAKYSLDQATKAKGGSLGLLQWGRSVPTFQKAAFEIEPGTISQPIETEFGAHILRVKARVPQTLGTQEAMAPGLREEVRRQKEVVRLREFVKELEEKAKLTWNDAGIELLQQLTDANAQKDIDTIPAERQNIPDATDEQKQTALATFQGRSWTIGDYIGWLSLQPPTNRPVTRLPKRGLEELIRTTQIQNELVVAEAMARGLDERPEAKDEDTRIREQVLIEIVHSRFLQEADVPQEEVKALYDSTFTANPEALRIPERINMKVLVSMKPEVVREGLRRIRGGESEEKVILELSEDMRTKFKGGETGLIARANYAPQLEDAAFARKPGSGWSDPIVTETGTGAVKVLAYEPSKIATFEEVKDGITRSLVQGRGERAFEDWLTKQRETLGAKVHDAVLALMGQAVSGGSPAAPSTQPPGGGAAVPVPSGDHSHDAGAGGGGK